MSFNHCCVGQGKLNVFNRREKHLLLMQVLGTPMQVRSCAHSFIVNNLHDIAISQARVNTPTCKQTWSCSWSGHSIALGLVENKCTKRVLHSKEGLTCAYLPTGFTGLEFLNLRPTLMLANDTRRPKGTSFRGINNGDRPHLLAEAGLEMCGSAQLFQRPHLTLDVGRVRQSLGMLGDTVQHNLDAAPVNSPAASDLKMTPVSPFSLWPPKCLSEL